MTSFLASLFSSSSSKDAPPPPHTFRIRPSSTKSSWSDTDTYVIHPDGHPVDAAPIYTFIGSKHRKPNIEFFHGQPSPQTKIGEATYSTMGSTTTASLRGQALIMKMSQLSGNFTFFAPQGGEMKWKVNQLTGSSLKLVDGSGREIASHKSAGFPGVDDKKLEVYVDSDPYFLEFLVFTGVVAKFLTRALTEAAAEIAGAAG